MPEKENAQQDGRRDTLVGVFLAALVFVVYCLTLCRTIYTGDDGDFIVCMATFGNSHPTGYPLFLLLGHLFLWLLSPVLADPAARINTMTALFGASAIGLFYRFLVQGLRVERFWAAAGALLLAFSPTLWQQSLSCEVYSLTCLYLTGILYLTVVWARQPENTARLRFLTFLYGLACTNHLTIVLFLPGFLIFVLCKRPALLKKDLPVLLSMVGLFVLPLSLYAYLPLAAKYANAPLNWGDPSTPGRFWNKITGAQYHELMFQSVRAGWHGAQRFAHLYWNEFRPWTLWLVPLGLVSLWRRDRALCLLLIYVWFANVLYAINYSIVDIYVYYIPSYLITATLIVAGASALMHFVWARTKLSPEQQEHYTPLLAIVVLLLPLVYMSLHYAETDESGNYLESDYSGNILRSAPSGAIVLTGELEIESLWYRKFVLHQRPDAVVIDRNMLRGAFIEGGWYYDNILKQYPDIAHAYDSPREMTDENAYTNDLLIHVIRQALAQNRPVLWVPSDNSDDKPQPYMHGKSVNDLISANFDRVPWGIGQRLYPKGEAPGEKAVFTANAALWPTFTYHDLPTWAYVDFMQDYMPLRYLHALLIWGQMCEKQGQKDQAEMASQLAQQLYAAAQAREGLQPSGATPATGTQQ